jgi:hypothetical protein
VQLSLEKAACMRSVDHAAELAGGYDALAERLGVCSNDVVDWVCGMACPDTTTFLFVLDLIMEETRKLASSTMAFGLAEQALAKASDSSKAV